MPPWAKLELKIGRSNSSSLSFSLQLSYAILHHMTEHIALYRKYRPQNFDEVRGQDHIVEALQGAIKNKKIAHAYLFAGSRGTGKTTVARIFAHEIGASDNDIYEIDAASNRGIDDIRELREAVVTLPIDSPYKVYIVDEVHMLTKDAFNALLKTLEEPPQYVVFILATTEPEKVLETVRSRCQMFAFKKPNEQLLQDVVISIAKKEGFTVDKSAAELVALLGDGSFRDTEGILQKILASTTEKKVSVDQVARLTGAPSTEIVNGFITSLAQGDNESGLMYIKQASEENIDMMLFVKIVLQKLRLILLLRYAPKLRNEIQDEVSDTDFAFFETMSGKKGKALNSMTLQKLLVAAQDMRFATVPSLPLETMLFE